MNRAREHVGLIESDGGPGDAEQELLDHLAALKAAVASGVGGAPDLAALRNIIGDLFVIGDLFAEVRLVRSGSFPQGPPIADGMIPWHHDDVGVADGEDRYWLLLTLRWSAVDRETLKPIGQAMPVPAAQSYPPGFFARYCWW